jgi:hypothetical protein
MRHVDDETESALGLNPAREHQLRDLEVRCSHGALVAG